MVNDNQSTIIIGSFLSDEILEHKPGNKGREETPYETNEVNGKFRITSEQWNERLNDPNTIEYQELSETLKTGLREMLEEDETLKEQADFDVDIVKFR